MAARGRGGGQGQIHRVSIVFPGNKVHVLPAQLYAGQVFRAQHRFQPQGHGQGSVLRQPGGHVVGGDKIRIQFPQAAPVGALVLQGVLHPHAGRALAGGHIDIAALGGVGVGGGVAQLHPVADQPHQAGVDVLQLRGRIRPDVLAAGGVGDGLQQVVVHLAEADGVHHDALGGQLLHHPHVQAALAVGHEQHGAGAIGPAQHRQGLFQSGGDVGAAIGHQFPGGRLQTGGIGGQLRRHPPGILKGNQRGVGPVQIALGKPDQGLLQVGHGFAAHAAAAVHHAAQLVGHALGVQHLRLPVHLGAGVLHLTLAVHQPLHGFGPAAEQQGHLGEFAQVNAGGIQILAVDLLVADDPVGKALGQAAGGQGHTVGTAGQQRHHGVPELIRLHPHRVGAALIGAAHGIQPVGQAAGGAQAALQRTGRAQQLIHRPLVVPHGILQPGAHDLRLQAVDVRDGAQRPPGV